MHTKWHNMKMVTDRPSWGGGGIDWHLHYSNLRHSALILSSQTGRAGWGRILEKIRKKSFQDFLRYEGKYESSIFFRLKLQWLRHCLSEPDLNGLLLKNCLHMPDFQIPISRRVFNIFSIGFFFKAYIFLNVKPKYQLLRSIFADRPDIPNELVP